MEPPAVNRHPKTDEFIEIAERLHAALSAVVVNGKPTEEPGKTGASAPKKEDKKDDIPAFWRICGAAALSITAMVAVTLYIQLSNSVAGLRSELNSLRDHNHEVVRKDDYNSRNLAIAATIKELQANNAATLELWKERATTQERQLEENKQTIRALEREVQQLRERLTLLERQPTEPSRTKPPVPPK